MRPTRRVRQAAGTFGAPAPRSSDCTRHGAWRSRTMRYSFMRGCPAAALPAAASNDLRAADASGEALTPERYTSCFRMHASRAGC